MIGINKENLILEKDIFEHSQIEFIMEYIFNNDDRILYFRISRI